MKEQIKMIIGLLLITVGVVILIPSIVVSVAQYTGKQKIVKEFELEKKEARERLIDEGIVSPEDTDSSKEEIEYPPVDAGMTYLVRIPKIDSVEPVSEGTDKHALSASLGHEIGTAFPGEKGNCVIAGHRNYTFGKYFNRLDEIEVGDKIYVDSPYTTYTYEVSDIKVVEPTDMSVLDDTEDEQITLYTCTPIYVATHRLVIVAKRIEE